MKLSTLGIFLLTAMIVAKFIVSRQSADPETGSLTGGIGLYAKAINPETNRITHQNNPLLALTSHYDNEAKSAPSDPVGQSSVLLSSASLNEHDPTSFRQNLSWPSTTWKMTNHCRWNTETALWFTT